MVQGEVGGKPGRVTQRSVIRSYMSIFKFQFHLESVDVAMKFPFSFIFIYLFFLLDTHRLTKVPNRGGPSL